MFLSKVALVATMVCILALGYGQLAFGAGSCPPYHCEDLYWCDIDLNPIGTCNDCWGPQEIFPVESCGRITTCFAHVDYGEKVSPYPVPYPGGCP